MYILHKILRNDPKMFKMSINCTFLSDLISEYTSKLEECTGYGITLVEEMEKGMIDMNLFPNCDETGYNAIMLEHSLFKVGSIPNLIYMLPIFRQGKLFLR